MDKAGVTTYRTFLDNISNKAPHNLEAEQGLIGCLLYDNKLYDRVFDIIRPEHFYAPVHQRIFESIKIKIEGGKSAIPTTLYKEFENDKELDDSGGAKEYLLGLVTSVISPANAPDYAKHIKELYLKRSLADALGTAASRIESGDDLREVISQTESALSQINDGGFQDFESASLIWNETLQYIEDVKNGRIRITSTKYQSIDKMMAGFQAGRLYVLAARPGMGKTALALNMAENVTEEGDVLFFSLEMPKSELCMRLGSRKTSISVGLQSRGKLDDYQIKRLAETRMPDNLYIYDKSGINVGTIINICRRFKRQKNAKLIVIDYLGLIDGDPRLQKVHQIEEITKKLKNLSKQLGVPVLLLCQLSRALENRDDKRPMLSDLRDSGAIEQDADVVMFVYRPDYYAGKDEPAQFKGEVEEKYKARLAEYHAKQEQNKGKAEVIFAKNRQGTLGTAIVTFDGERQYFFEEGI